MTRLTYPDAFFAWSFPYGIALLLSILLFFFGCSFTAGMDNPDDGGFDATVVDAATDAEDDSPDSNVLDAGDAEDAGEDATSLVDASDAEPDSGFDAGTMPVIDAGSEADAGSDAGEIPCPADSSLTGEACPCSTGYRCLNPRDGGPPSWGCYIRCVCGCPSGTTCTPGPDVCEISG